MRSIERKEGNVKGCFVLIYRLLIVIITDQSKGRFLTSSTKKNYHEIGLLKCLFKIPFSSNRFSYSAISLTSFRSYKYTRKKHPSKKNVTNMSNVVPVILPPHTLLSLIQIHVIFSKLISTR